MTLWKVFVGGKAAMLAVVALSMTTASLVPTMPIFAQLFGPRTIPAQFQLRAPATLNEMERRIEKVEGINIEHRLTALEISAQQTTERLGSIEMLIRILLVGLASLVGETVWSSITRLRKSP